MDITHELTTLLQPRVCARCRRNFTELENLGTWRCSFHPGTVSYDGDTSTLPNCYDCCNLPVPGCYEAHVHGSRHSIVHGGCTPCDHVQYTGEYLPPVQVYSAENARVLFDAAFFDRDGVLYDEESDEYLIVRRADHVT